VLTLYKRLTNDGNAILREIEVAHPAAKNMIELSRTQDEEVGDGTTSVIIIGALYPFISTYLMPILPPYKAGEILAQSLPLLERNIHPVVIISALNKALKESLDILKSISIPIDTSSDDQMLSLIKTSIGTKFVIRWSDLMCRLALDAVRTVTKDDAGYVIFFFFPSQRRFNTGMFQDSKLSTSSVMPVLRRSQVARLSSPNA